MIILVLRNASNTLRVEYRTDLLSGNNAFTVMQTVGLGDGEDKFGLGLRELPRLLSDIKQLAVSKNLILEQLTQDGITGLISQTALNITTTTLPNGSEIVPYSQVIASVGGNGNKVFSLDSGTLPVGLTLSDNGTISGTPTTAVVAALVFKVTDEFGVTDTQAITLTIVV